jgi:hypothetical protein
MQPKYLGMLQTVWGPAGSFMESYRGAASDEQHDSSADCFKALVDAWKN